MITNEVFSPRGYEILPRSYEMGLCKKGGEILDYEKECIINEAKKDFCIDCKY